MASAMLSKSKSKLPSSSSSSASSVMNGSSVTLVELKRSLVPQQWTESVRPVRLAECREAALSLAHAFAADDYAKYLVDPGDTSNLSPEDKWKLHVDMMVYVVAAHCIDGIATTIGPHFDSVALWLAPGQDLDGWWTLLRSGLWRLYFQLSPEGKRRYFDEVLPLLHDTKADVLGDRDADAWYLVYLGTKPYSQGRGYAKRLLEDGIQRADAENRPIYLESSSESNNAYYKKFGFEIKRDVFLERGQAPVRLSIMVREPQASISTTNNAVSAPPPRNKGTSAGAVAPAVASKKFHHHHQHHHVNVGGGDGAARRWG
ncbi:hypothetical protein B0T19DRAFT_401829 [Cercophora scortea]|uniref:N-acetyltransferase domain-containing protein n=1 Tax=Cercophora scortea TaxID=314031 RepID=A0AAE0M8S2_9PEZI|nr:hypothetical protein B0T19DRAFT_401829 [Cercophora scortea]